jgi:hypothetical protein
MPRERGRVERHAAIAEDRARLPEFEQQEQRGEADDRSGHVGQVRPHVHRDGILAEDVAERTDDRERPCAPHAGATGDEIQQHPRRQQGEHGDDRADRTRQREQGIAGDRGEADDRRAERAVRHRRVVRNRGDADRVEVGDAERNQDRRDHRPRIAEADEAFEQRAEGPGEQHRLHTHVGAALGDQPAPEILEQAGQRQGVE